MADLVPDHSQPSSSSLLSSSPSHGNSLTVDRICRRVLGQCIGAICGSAGFTCVQTGALDSLVGILDRFLGKSCRASHQFCEHTGRSLVAPCDVFMALVDIGFDLRAFPDFLHSVLADRTPHPAFNLKSQTPPQELPVLRISEPRTLPSQFPNFLPNFPDPHTFISTEVRDEVDTNYEKVRRLNAQNKRNTENSLINLAISVYPSISTYQELEKRLFFEAKDKLQSKKTEGALKKTETMLNECSNEMLNSEGANGDLTADAFLLNGGDGEGRKKNLENGKPSSMDECLANGDSTKELELMLDELLSSGETERSLVLKTIPPFCFVLLPFEEQRSYVSALVTDDADLDDDHDQNYFAKILSREMEEDFAEMEEEERAETGNNE